MLTALMYAMPITWFHAIQRWQGVYEGMHDFLHGFCPCGE